MRDWYENTPGKPLVGAIRESPVSAQRTFSFQVVRVATLMTYSEEPSDEKSIISPPAGADRGRQLRENNAVAVILSAAESKNSKRRASEFD